MTQTLVRITAVPSLSTVDLIRRVMLTTEMLNAEQQAIAFDLFTQAYNPTLPNCIEPMLQHDASITEIKQLTLTQCNFFTTCCAVLLSAAVWMYAENKMCLRRGRWKLLLQKHLAPPLWRSKVSPSHQKCCRSVPRCRSGVYRRTCQ